MEAFLTILIQRFKVQADKVILNALNLRYTFEEMIYILYVYELNMKDPFLDETSFIAQTKKLGIGYVMDELFIIYGKVAQDKNKELNELVLEDNKMDSGFIE